MHITTIAFFSTAAAVMAAPSAPILAPQIWTATPSDGNVVPAGIKDQGDGFYLAVFNGTELDRVEFTPLNDDVKPLTSADLSVRQSTALELDKRAGTTCGNRYTSNLNDLTKANIQLAQNGDRKWYDKHAWGWVSRIELQRAWSRADTSGRFILARRRPFSVITRAIG
jgi:hypothetical protein